jgi:hypothetical protein
MLYHRPSSLEGAALFLLKQFTMNQVMNFEWIDDVLPEDVGRHIVSLLDVPALVQKKAVCRSWQTLFTNTIR